MSVEKLQLEFAVSSVSLALSRIGYSIHKEFRGEEVLLHVYKHPAEATSEADFFVRVQVSPSLESAKEFRERKPSPKIYEKPTYVAQIIKDGAVAVFDAALENRMAYTKADFKKVEFV